MSKNNKKSDIRQISSLIKKGQELIRCGEREEGTKILLDVLRILYPCLRGDLRYYRNITWDDIMSQVHFNIVDKTEKDPNYTITYSNIRTVTKRFVYSQVANFCYGITETDFHQIDIMRSIAIAKDIPINRDIAYKFTKYSGIPTGRMEHLIEVYLENPIFHGVFSVEDNTSSNDDDEDYGDDDFD